MQKLIVLDRDGVINEDSDAFVKNAEEWIEYEVMAMTVLPEVVEAERCLYTGVCLKAKEDLVAKLYEVPVPPFDQGQPNLK